MKRTIKTLAGANEQLYIWLRATVRNGIRKILAITGYFLYRFRLINNVDEFVDEAFGKIIGIEEKTVNITIFNRLRFPFEKLLASPGVPMLAPDQFRKGSILHVNSALSWGGAERQVVNTILGLRQKGIDDVSLVCQRLYEFDQSDFYIWKLHEAGVDVAKVRQATIDDISRNGYADISKHIAKVSRTVRETLVNYVLEMYQQRPEVVHFWQDSTNILGGIAACIVGVPKIILCTRNMAPYHFAYYQSYMKPGYLLLANQPNVRFINNSHAGKNDYVQWLGIPDQKFSVVLNGLNKSDIPDVSARDRAVYRDGLGIPVDAVVVGSIFRFYAEKDPLLWLRTAAEIIKHDPDRKIVFLLIGTGPDPMINSMRSLASELGIADRLFMPGIEKHPALPLSVMDVFLLTSINEGTPNVVIEAQFYGVPVVATDAGGTRDTIINGTTGWIVESRSPSELADKVVQILDDSLWLQNARNVAPIFAKENFGLDRMVSDMLAVYDIK